MAEILLVGYSGHAFVVADVILDNKHSIIGYFDMEEKANNPYNLKFLGNEYSDAGLLEYHRSGVLFALGLGENQKRKSAFQHLSRFDLQAVTVVHSTAFVSRYARIGKGSVVMPRAVVNSQSQIGTGSIVNSGAIIEHECIVGDFSHVAPGAIVAGNVTIKDDVFVGANSTVRQGLKIERGAVIGAGSVVLQDIPENETWAGVPAKKISK